MLVASQALRLFAREKRAEAERAQMVDAGRRALRTALERARQELVRHMSDYRAGALAALRVLRSAADIVTDRLLG